METARTKVFKRELERIQNEERKKAAKEQAENEGRLRYERLVREAAEKHVRGCATEMLMRSGLYGYGGFTLHLAYARDGKFVIQLHKSGEIKYETLDKLADIFDTKKISLSTDGTAGGGGCDSCDYGSEPETYHVVGLDEAFIDMEAIQRPQFGPYRSGWFLVVTDLPAYYAWVGANIVDPSHAVIVDSERILSTVTFWDKDQWKIVTPAPKTSAPFTHNLVDKLLELGFKEWEE